MYTQGYLYPYSELDLELSAEEYRAQAALGRAIVHNFNYHYNYNISYMNDIISVLGTMALGFFFASWLVAR